MHPEDRHVIFCFAGQGYVPLDASRDLFKTCEVFRKSIEEVDSAVEAFYEAESELPTSIPLSKYLKEREPRPAHTPSFDSESVVVDNGKLATPTATMVIFAAQYALARTIEAHGIQPSGIVGYSFGEHIASVVTGSLPLDAGICYLLRREKLMEDRGLVPNVGGMVTVQAEPEKVTQALAANGASGEVEISGYPHKTSTILSGDAKALDDAQEALDDGDIDTQRRAIQLGMHSSHIEAITDRIRNDPLVFSDEESSNAKVLPGIDHWSCLGVQLSEGTPLNAKYWATQLRSPIHFKQCIEGIYHGSVTKSPQKKIVFLDLGMGPRLARLIQNTLQDTPEWKRGQIEAISCIQPMALDAAAKEKRGWAFEELTTRLGLSSG
ncbi:hypothetical protein LTR36_002971 [Oleoguttula mirabilis]|uniref:Malonyl-CoA:ACP transacylase (MAT) domain-containing protein n=1 Tax=Oleoguttula mirabilis TaxID=1507867 RepID=A0AAV9JWI6_9PEZI|nr:hypothetical protein LTR36_002971 [Oleoguttula mirabilis]